MPRLARRLSLAAFMLLSGLAAAADPEALVAHHCVPGDPEHGDYALTGGLIEVVTDTDRNQPTPGFVGAVQWMDGIGWVDANDLALLSGTRTGNRVDLVFVGDGYTAADLPLYEQQVTTFVDDVFIDEPLRSYRPFFRIHRVDVISNESGITNDPVQGIFRDTALEMQYWCSGIERALCVNVGLALAYADQAILPNNESPDQVIAVANSSKYGGVGYPSSNLGTAAAGNNAAYEIVVHELGHSMADLADEYTYGGPTFFPGPEPSAANTSMLEAPAMAAQDRKWSEWLGVNLPEWDGLHDTFEGGQYSVENVYRPTVNSRMRELFRPFNLIAAEEFIKEIYREVAPIDSFGPSQNISEHAQLFVDVVTPETDTISIQWFFDNQPIAGATSATLDTQAFGLSGSGLITVRVQDTTPWVRDEAFRETFMTQQVFFFANNLPASCTGDIADDFGALSPDGEVAFGDFLAMLGLLGPCPGGAAGCMGDIADDFGSPQPDAQVTFGDFLLLLGLLGPCA